MSKNFMSYEDAIEVLTPFAEGIKNATPIELTYEQYQSLTPEQQNNGNYIVSDYPEEDIPSLTPQQLDDLINCL